MGAKLGRIHDVARKDTVIEVAWINLWDSGEPHAQLPTSQCFTLSLLEHPPLYFLKYIYFFPKSSDWSHDTLSPFTFQIFCRCWVITVSVLGAAVITCFGVGPWHQALTIFPQPSGLNDTGHNWTHKTKDILWWKRGTAGNCIRDVMSLLLWVQAILGLDLPPLLCNRPSKEALNFFLKFFI